MAGASVTLSETMTLLELVVHGAEVFQATLWDPMPVSSIQMAPSVALAEVKVVSVASEMIPPWVV